MKMMKTLILTVVGDRFYGSALLKKPKRSVPVTTDGED